MLSRLFSPRPPASGPGVARPGLMLLGATVSAGALFAAQPATAQITADDVWSNSQALYAGFGGVQTATLSRTGDTVQVSGDSIRWALPMGVGTMILRIGDYTLTETGDGTVIYTYPAPLTFDFEVDLPTEGRFEATFEFGPDPLVTTASGTPGAISYLTEIGPSTLVLTGYDVESVGDFNDDTDDFDIEIEVGYSGGETLTRVIEDTLTVVYSQSRFGPTTTVFAMDMPDFSSRSESVSGDTVFTLNMGLIPGGADLLDLTKALRDGMYISGESRSDSSESVTENVIFGQLSDRQEASSGPFEASFQLDRSGIGTGFSAADVLVDIKQYYTTPPVFGFGMESVSGGFLFPLLAEPEAQEFFYELALDGLRLGQPIWAMFDPDKQLDRSPASFALDISGSAVNKVDWTDILALEGLQIENELPMDVTSVMITELSLSALGALVEGQGSFTFDAGDTTTYPGVPRPTGEAALDATGLNQAIERLAEAGLLDTEMLFGFRMALGMVTDPGDGPDTLTSRIEMTQDGQIIANGQRLR